MKSRDDKTIKKHYCKGQSYYNLHDNPDNDGWQHYNLAADYYNRGNIENAYASVNASISFFIDKRLKPPSQIYKLRYELLIARREFAEAYSRIVKVITLYPDYVDLHFFKGILQFVSGEYDKAKKTFSYCLILGEFNTDYQVILGAGSFLALYYIGLCCQKLGLVDEAAEAFRQAEILRPNLDITAQFKRYFPQ